MKYTISVHRIAAAAAFFVFMAAQSSAQPSLPLNPGRIVLGGRAVVMVADAVYAFPSARSSVVSIAGTDQGLGTFLEAVEPGFLAKPSLARTAGAEAYAALKPDMVILKTAMKASLGDGLSALGIPALYVSLETPEDYYRDLKAIGSLFAAEARAEELILYYKAMTARAVNVVDAAKRKGVVSPRVLVVQAAGGGYEVPPASWMQTALVELAGGIPVWKGANPGAGWAAVSPEQILVWNPDVVIVISYKEDSAGLARSFKADLRFSSLSSVKQGRVYGYAQDFYSWDQPDTRWGLGLAWLSRALYPDAFASVNGRTDGMDPLEAEARRFFSLFYGMDKEKYDTVIAPALKGDWR